MMKNSYIEGFGFPGEETQGICGWTGTRDVKILNNYIEGGAENIMFGGADIANADLIPANIMSAAIISTSPTRGTRASGKNPFRDQERQERQFAGNLMTNNWKGSAFRITVRNQNGGSPYTRSRMRSSATTSSTAQATASIFSEKTMPTRARR